jgi:hypothetical protein
MKRLLMFVTILAVHLATPLISFGQSTDASLMGRVIDPQKAAVPAASIEATNVDKNVSYTAKTNNDGLFSIPNLPVATVFQNLEAGGMAHAAKRFQWPTDRASSGTRERVLRFVGIFGEPSTYPREEMRPF